MTALNLPIARYRFQLKALTPIQFPAYAGSMWRGAFGTALKRAVCVTQQAKCEGCLLKQNCVYNTVFETPAGQEPLLRKNTEAPHPYIIHPLATSGASYAAGELFTVQLTVLGKALIHLPYFIHCFQQMGEHGLGAHQGRFEVLALLQEQDLGAEDWQLIYPLATQALQALTVRTACVAEPPARLRLAFTTPFRARQQGRLMTQDDFDLVTFLMGLVRRLSLLSAYHAQALRDVDFVALRAQAQQVELVAAELQGFAWKRRSNRQQRWIAMDGLVGSLELSGAGLASLWPWLWWGQWVHAGKATVMGQGHYVLEAVA
jgi:hypothetical protein